MTSFIDKILENPIWQWFWLLAMTIAFIWLLQKNDKRTITVFIFSNLSWALHFYFMWVTSAMVTNIIWIWRLFLSLKYKRNKRIFFWILAAIITMWILTYEDQVSLLPIIGSCISAYWYFFFERLRLRIFMFVSSMFWITFNTINWSIWWILNEIIVQIILIFTMYRMIKKEWERVYFVDKVMSILHKPIPDVWRFIVIYDYIKLKHHRVKEFFWKIKDKTKYYYNKANSVKIYVFKKWRKFIEIEY